MRARLACLGIGCALFLPLLQQTAEPAVRRDAPAPTAPASSAIKLEVFPSEVELHGPRATQRLIVIASYADGRQWEVTSQAKFEPKNPALLGVEASSLKPKADGKTELTVACGPLHQTLPVLIQQSQADWPIDFCREVIPILSKQGCNQGACHGQQFGKGGFKQSLFGFDPEADHEQIVRHSEGRRIVFSDPEKSLLLRKPSLELAHGGGRRLPTNSTAYERLATWIADGAPAPKADEPAIAEIRVYPTQRRMQPGENQQLIVQARWSDGRIEDVTDFARYDSITDGQAKVEPSGIVTCIGKGEGAVMIRYLGQATVTHLVSPYALSDRTGSLPEHLVDRHLEAKWRELGLSPSPSSSDAEFLRRASLDLIGTLPTVEEVRAFAADTDAQKRAKLIDRLLDRPEYIDFWTLKWGDLLRNNRATLELKGMFSLHEWLRANFRDNKPVDQFVREILTAQGSAFREGPANFYRIGNNATDWSEAASQLFLGVRMQCAKCHHHPFEKWSQDDYYGMAAFFVRLGTKPSQEFGIFGRENVVFLRPNGEQNHPRKGGVVKPHPPEGQVMDDPDDRRIKLAEWLTAKDNPYFARNFVNRYWAYFMGRGLVEPIDDLRATNPASNEALLSALAADFVSHGYNLKHLARLILTSQAYALSSKTTPRNAADVENRYHARYRVKRLSAEQLADALDIATGTREKYQGLPAGTRAIQLPDPAVPSYLLNVFGRPGRRQVCECERTTTPNLAQALHLLNSEFLSGKIARQEGRIDKLFKAKKPLPEVIEELYLATLCRWPSGEEKDRALALIQEAPSPRSGAEDLLWALLNAPEFLFVH